MGTQAVDQEFQVIVAETSSFLARAKFLAVNIKDQASFEEASAFRKQINAQKKSRLEKLAWLFSESRQAAKAIFDDIKTKERMIEGPHDEALNIIGPPLTEYFLDQERKRKADQDRLQAIAQKQRDDAALAAAEAARARGDVQKAEAIIQKAAEKQAPAPKLMKTIGAPGTSFATYYSVDEKAAENLDNLFLLVRAVAEGRKPVGALMANITFLNGEARSMKEAFDYPGMKLVAITRQRG